jgi:CheY-like chemotaxis protein
MDSKSSQAGGNSGSLAVLLIDDDPMVRRVATRALTAAGADVVEVASGTEGLERLERMTTGPDVVVSDVRMPGLSGRDVADALALCRPTLPILLISGFAVDLVGDRRVRVLPKPFTPDQLVAAVREEFERARSLRDGGPSGVSLFQGSAAGRDASRRGW